MDLAVWKHDLKFNPFASHRLNLYKPAGRSYSDTRGPVVVKYSAYFIVRVLWPARYKDIDLHINAVNPLVVN